MTPKNPLVLFQACRQAIFLLWVLCKLGLGKAKVTVMDILDMDIKMLFKAVNHHSHTYFTLWCEKPMSRTKKTYCPFIPTMPFLRQQQQTYPKHIGFYNHFMPIPQFVRTGPGCVIVTKVILNLT